MKIALCLVQMGHVMLEMHFFSFHKGNASGGTVLGSSTNKSVKLHMVKYPKYDIPKKFQL